MSAVDELTPKPRTGSPDQPDITPLPADLTSAPSSPEPAATNTGSTPASPAPPAAPPEPPPSLVAMRRLLFDTDDAKLMKHDHTVNNTRLVHRIKKDLSLSVDTSSHISNPVNITIDKDLPSNYEEDNHFKNSESLEQNVNNTTTIPAILNLCESETESIKNVTSPCLNECENDSVKLEGDPIKEEPLDVSRDTPSFNDNGNTLSSDKLSLHSENDVVEKLSKNEDINIETTDTNLTTSEKEIDETFESTTEVRSVVNIHSDAKTSKLEVSKINSSEYPSHLNPFGDSDGEESPDTKGPKPRTSTNPFGSDSEDEEETVVPVHPPPRTPRKMSVGMRSTVSTNPFGSDEEDEEEAVPVPTPRLVSLSFFFSPDAYFIFSYRLLNIVETFLMSIKTSKI